MNFSGVDFVEQLHQDECIEDDCEVHRWSRSEASADSALVDAEEIMFEEEQENDDELNPVNV